MTIEAARGDRPGGIALVGYRATGKSTVARIVADRLGWAFEDADAALEGRAGRSIAAIFADRGEGAFRDLEQETIAELTGRDRLVIASGGGAVLREANRDRLRGFGFVAWLAARPGTIVDRLRRDPAGRPALTPAGLLDEVAEILRVREPLYRATADAVIETDLLPADRVAEAVIRGFLEHLGAPRRPFAARDRTP